MEKKKVSKIEKKLKRKIVLGLISLLVSSLPFLFIVLLFAAIAPAVTDEAFANYKTAAEAAGCSWQELLAFDTVRYDNDFDEADPFQSAMEFMSVYYEKYKREVEEGVERWVLVDKGWLSTPEAIRSYFSLSPDSGVNELQDALTNFSPPKYVIQTNAKDVEDVISEHSFNQEQIEWIGQLLAEGLLDEMFGEEYNLPDFITAGNGYFGWPIPGRTNVTSTFGSRIHPVTGEKSYHYGVDIGAPEGTPVVAIEEGVVTGASYYGGTAGVNVKIRHEKDGYVWESRYFHLSQIAVSIGEKVERGTVIAASGNTGRSTGPHLHIGITLNGSYVDPLPLITD